jgi:hypothetical protein
MITSNEKFEIFELVTVDINAVMQFSILKYKYIALFVDKATSYTIPKLIKAKTDFLSKLEEVINQLSLSGNPKLKNLKYLLPDFDTVVIDQETTDFLKTNNIIL